MHKSRSPTDPFIQIHIYHMHILHGSSSKSSACPATNRRNAIRGAEANAKWNALQTEMRKYQKRRLESERNYTCNSKLSMRSLTNHQTTSSYNPPLDPYKSNTDIIPRPENSNNTPPPNQAKLRFLDTTSMLHHVQVHDLMTISRHAKAGCNVREHAYMHQRLFKKQEEREGKRCGRRRSPPPLLSQPPPPPAKADKS